MTHVPAYRRKARLIDHAAPPTPGEWLEHDARYFEDIEAEIRRRAAGGRPEEAPWASPLYFDTAAREASATRRALLALRHLSPGAVVHLVLGRLFHGEGVRPGTAPCAERREDGDAEGREHRAPDGRTRFPEGTLSPPARSGRTVVAQSAGA